MKHEARSTKSETSTKQKILNFVSLEFRISNFEFYKICYLNTAQLTRKEKNKPAPSKRCPAMWRSLRFRIAVFRFQQWKKCRKRRVFCRTKSIFSRVFQTVTSFFCRGRFQPFLRHKCRPCVSSACLRQNPRILSCAKRFL